MVLYHTARGISSESVQGSLAVDMVSKRGSNKRATGFDIGNSWPGSDHPSCQPGNRSSARKEIFLVIEPRLHPMS